MLCAEISKAERIDVISEDGESCSHMIKSKRTREDANKKTEDERRGERKKKKKKNNIKTRPDQAQQFQGDHA